MQTPPALWGSSSFPSHSSLGWRPSPRPEQVSGQPRAGLSKVVPVRTEEETNPGPGLTLADQVVPPSWAWHPSHSPCPRSCPGGLEPCHHPRSPAQRWGLMTRTHTVQAAHPGACHCSAKKYRAHQSMKPMVLPKSCYPPRPGPLLTPQQVPMGQYTCIRTIKEVSRTETQQALESPKL